MKRVLDLAQPDEQGRAGHELDLPRFSGELMAHDWTRFSN